MNKPIIFIISINLLVSSFSQGISTHNTLLSDKIQIEVVASPVATSVINYMISPQLDQQLISPYIYGSNWDLLGGENITFYRSGGNRLTGYNWVNNASHAGNDWFHFNDNFLTWPTPEPQASTPGLVMTNFFDSCTSKNAQGVITIPMAGYVSKDKNGTSVTVGETAPSSRWCQILPFKGSPFTLTPTLSSNSVYVDEFLSFMTTKYGTATNGGVVAYCLDNETGLWSNTHPRIHPTAAQCTEMIQRSTTWSLAIKSIDSTALVFGPVSYGFNDYLSLQNAPDWGSVSGSYGWFLSYYLHKMFQASTTHGKRLLDVLDVHNYSEVTGIHRINTTNPGSDNNTDKLVRLQAPRELWDKNYIQPSWIGQGQLSYWSAYCPYILAIQSSINIYNPGTKIAFTEYNYGGSWDITGGIAQADALGIYGKYGIYAATYWPLGNTETYTSLAFKMYRNYDGINSTFGDLHIRASANDTVTTSIYASVMSTNHSQLHIMVLNKSMTDSIQGNFTISSLTTFNSGKAYSISSNSTTISGPVNFSVTGNTFTFDLLPLTVTHMILSPTVLDVPDWIRYTNRDSHKF